MKMPKKFSTKVQKITGTCSRMSVLNDPEFKQDIYLFSPIVLWEYNHFIILRLKFFSFCVILMESQVLPAAFDRSIIKDKF